MFVGIAYPNQWGLKDFKFSASAMGPSPLVASVVAVKKS